MLQSADGNVLFDRPFSALSSVVDKPEASTDGLLASLKVGQLSDAGEFTDCFCQPVPVGNNAGTPAGCEWVGLRSILMAHEEALFLMAGAAVQLVNWLDTHRYCGRCGAVNQLQSDDRAMLCSGCNLRYYPRLSPCVIVLITRGDECLLAVHRRSSVQMFTALAGFVEPGESLETAVAREALEEVGLAVERPEYVGSQPWPFPGQLMMGFCASVAAGPQALQLQDDEITEAGWFKYNQLPAITPPVQSLSGQLIAKFVEDCRHRYG
ncbi:NAD(+) diphosphatase [Simiduia sp. 21SJ11W-1]|uniref:NAD(+) diphosphatase n=1 Tax=Simiduia sp. 21SJ11W-1 TaxID=2909669 RepID=UPI00209E84FC|nr:NAD(+) diphosphatase [Simiduia sp. 21SJ11W-1]UTA46372.1 NAD(+) diphosphatase [Simiduia sp. 21SJ11W-1]